MKLRYGFLAAGCAALAGWAIAQSASDPLESGFRNPPQSAKPRTWWHWTNGNVTKEGITKDLEWMKRVGIAGFQLADVAAGQGQTVEHKILFGTPEWYDAVRHAASEADRLGLEMAIFSSAGWSETGGPWVKPEQAMKKLVWSETTVEGPRNFAEKLPHPPSNNGPVRNYGSGGGRGNPDPTYYGDSAVLAYPTPPAELRMTEYEPKITASSGPIDAKPLIDDDLNTSVTIPAAENGAPTWLQFEFTRPFPARAISLGGRGIPVGRLLAGDSTDALHTIVTLPGPQGYHGALARTFAFPETTARIYRIELTAAPLSPAAVINGGPIQTARQFTLSEAILYAGGRVHRWEDKGGFGSLMDEYETSPTPPVPPAAEIGRSGIVNLTSKMSADGTLNWDVPAGKWTILRLGYSLTGAKNRPATPAGLGFEADKLSRKHMESYYHGYMDPIVQALGPLVGKSLRYMMMDSWEAGMQNWTEDMPAQFQRLRGYDPTPWLPVLAGRIVESSEASDRFLWDFRRTLADLYAEAHYGTMAEMLRQRGMGIYGEASGVALEILEDSLLNKSKVEIPMGEFWVRALHPESMYYVDVRGAASAAHVYGKPIAATESFTGGGYEAPYTLKRVADYWFAQGVNRLVFHTSAHQPLDTKPGNTMVGTHIHRNITWAEQAAPLMTYFARNSFMLQQGKPVADIAYLLREGAPSTMPFWGAGLQPSLPDGYDYDFVNTDVLLNRLSVAADGRLMLPDGVSYRVLVLPQIGRMTPAVARKIRDLVAGGATVVGPRPTASPSLAGYPDADREVRSIGGDVWGDANCTTLTSHAYGKGRIVCGRPLDEVMAALKVPKDVELSHPLDSDIVWIHRAASGADIYFVANHTDHRQTLEARFRVQGKAPELWHPDSGAIEPADYMGNGSIVPLDLGEREAVFVVFRHDAAQPARHTPASVRTTLATLDRPWDVAFAPNLGAPASARFTTLESWTANPDVGIKYFSGTATYRQSFIAPPEWFRAAGSVLLDLGVVKDLSEVTLNGKPLGIRWKPPYEYDVTAVVKHGTNQLEIKITNEWTNRLLGDRLVPDKRVFPAPPGPAGRGGGGFGFGPQQPAESGLLGPVKIVISHR